MIDTKKFKQALMYVTEPEDRPLIVTDLLFIKESSEPIWEDLKRYIEQKTFTSDDIVNALNVIEFADLLSGKKPTWNQYNQQVFPPYPYPDFDKALTKCFKYIDQLPSTKEYEGDMLGDIYMGFSVKEAHKQLTLFDEIEQNKNYFIIKETENVRQKTEEMKDVDLISSLFGESIQTVEDLVGTTNPIQHLTLLTEEDIEQTNCQNDFKEKLEAFLELKKRIELEENKDRNKVSNSHDFGMDLVRQHKNKTQEEFHAVFLDTQLKIIEDQMIFKGSLAESVAHPREVFKEAVKRSASSIIIYHNHPSGDPTPSKPDNITTENFVHAGEMLGIPVIDHFVLGKNNFYSYSEYGKINLYKNKAKNSLVAEENVVCEEEELFEVFSDIDSSKTVSLADTENELERENAEFEIWKKQYLEEFYKWKEEQISKQIPPTQRPEENSFNQEDDFDY